jgi:hypothetical protein
MDETVCPAGLPDNDLITRLVMLARDFELGLGDFAIFGSGPLLAHGLRRSVGDLDIVVSDAAWDRVAGYGLPAAGSVNGAPMSAFWGGLIQFSAGWISDDWDVSGLIARADVIGGLPFATLADVLRYKEILDRPKDREDIRAIREHLCAGDCGRAPAAL